MSSYSAQQQRTIFQLDCDTQWKVDFTRQPATTSPVVGPRSSKALSKAKGCTKKPSQSPFVVCCLSDPLQFSEFQWNHYKMLSKLMRYTRNCNACNQHWSTAWAQFSWKHPTAHVRTQHFKIWTNWAMKLCHPPYSRDLLPTTASSSIFTTFCRHNASTASRRQKTENAFQEFLEYLNMEFYATGINKFISHWQKCVDCNVSCFDY